MDWWVARWRHLWAYCRNSCGILLPGRHWPSTRWEATAPCCCYVGLPLPFPLGCGDPFECAASCCFTRTMYGARALRPRLGGPDALLLLCRMTSALHCMAWLAMLACVALASSAHAAAGPSWTSELAGSGARHRAWAQAGLVAIKMEDEKLNTRLLLFVEASRGLPRSRTVAHAQACTRARVVTLCRAVCPMPYLPQPRCVCLRSQSGSPAPTWASASRW